MLFSKHLHLLINKKAAAIFMTAAFYIITYSYYFCGATGCCSGALPIRSIN